MLGPRKKVSLKSNRKARQSSSFVHSTSSLLKCLVVDLRSLLLRYSGPALGVRAVPPNRALDAKGPDPRYVSRYSIFVLWPQPPKLEPSKLERHVRGCQFVLPHVDSANWLPHRRLRVLHFRRAAATAFFPAATCDSVRLRVRGGASASRARGNH